MTRVRISRRAVAATVAAAAVAPLALTRAPAPAATGPVTVVALADTGINPYSEAFRDRSPLGQAHPSTYIPGYPADAEALHLSLDLPYEEAVEKDAEVWESITPFTLYWIPGTRIAGAITMRNGGVCSAEAPPPVNGPLGGGCTEHLILDDNGHGTMTASRAAGAPHSLAPDARIVEVEGTGSDSLLWAAEQPWIDVQSHSWLSLIPPPVSGRTPADDTSAAFRHAATQQLTIAASGNGSAYLLGAAPTPTYALSTAAPGVVLVGAHDNGRAALWSGAPPHVVADGYAGQTALRTSSGPMQADPIACCTSAAAPYAAGGAAAIIREARVVLGSTGPGVKGGIVATGPEGVVPKGPLADGEFTLDELRRLLLVSAEAAPAEGKDDGTLHWSGEPRSPELTPYGPGSNPFCLLCTTTPLQWSAVPAGDAAYPFVGYGAINERSVEMAKRILRGEVDAPDRAAADAFFTADQSIREPVFP